MKIASVLAAMALCSSAATSMALADASLVSVVVCDPRGACRSILVDKAKANLVKTSSDSPAGSIVINSTVVENDDEAAEAMRECHTLKRGYESSARPNELFACRLEPADDAF